MAGSDTEQLVADGEVKDDGVQLEPEARTALAGKIAGSLADAMEDADDDDADPVVPDSDPEAASPADGSDPETPDEPEAGKDPETPNGKPKEAAEPGEAPDGSPTLPDAYRRSAHARQWTDEEIDAFWNADPERALSTFDKIHASRNAELAEFAKLGRQMKAGQTPQPTAGAAGADPAGGLPPSIDIEALISQHGEENAGMIHGIVDPVNQVLGQLHQVLPEIQSGLNAIRETEQKALGQQIEGFFTGESLKPYGSVYGTQAEGLSQEQTAHRMKVLELADALIAGSAYQGKEMPVEDALAAAHLSVSSEFTKQTVRQEIKDKLQKRKAAVGLKPNARSKEKSGGKPKNDGDRVKKVAEGLSSVFGNTD